METQEIRGDALARSVREDARRGLDALRAAGVSPRVASVVTEASPEVMAYAESQARAASELGVTFDLVVLPDGSTQAKLEDALRQLSADPAVHGIVLQLPLPGGFDADAALACIPAAKDLDGLGAQNIALLGAGREDEAILPATPQACLLLAENVRPLAGARVGVVGKGRTVGGPLILMLKNRGLDPVVCDSRTADLGAALHDCDIVFTATGRAGLIGPAAVREGQIVIDAGFSVDRDGKVRGDADLEALRGIAAAATPVPQGVGPVTTALIYKNLLKAIALQQAAH